MAAFMATSSVMLVAGCSGEKEDKPFVQNEKYDDQTLTDDSGKEYTLHKNADGTETATYKDGKTVTFKRDNDGNMNYVSGALGLIGGLAAGYMLFHGLGSSGGYYNGNSYRSSNVQRLTTRERDRRLTSSGYVPTNSAALTSNGYGSTRQNLTSGSTGSTSVARPMASGTQSGFGSAGARGGSAAS